MCVYIYTEREKERESAGRWDKISWLAGWLVFTVHLPFSGHLTPIQVILNKVSKSVR